MVTIGDIVHGKGGCLNFFCMEEGAMRNVRWALTAMLAMACGGAAKQQAPSAWLVPQERFFANVDTIGMGSVWIPDSLENPAPGRALFDSLVSEQLRLAGCAVVRVPEMRAFSDSEIREHGQFNPKTGEPDTAALRTATEHGLARLAQKYPQVDAFLMPDLVVVPALVEGNDAFWDGTSQDFTSFADVLLMRGYSGRLPAFSLCVRFWDPAGVPMYHDHGGVQLAATPKKVIERSKLFVDARRNLAAVRMALEPILRRPATKPVT